MQRHAKTQMVMVNVIVMTDVLFFILENNNKYTFFMPESNKEKETKVILNYQQRKCSKNVIIIFIGLKASCWSSFITKTFSQRESWN